MINQMRGLAKRRPISTAWQPLTRSQTIQKRDSRTESSAGATHFTKSLFACLGSRFPTGTPISKETLAQVEQAEEILRARGYHQFRVRHHDKLCRIEIEEDEFQRILTEKELIIADMKKAGYRFVTLDLCGYSMGSSA